GFEVAREADAGAFEDLIDGVVVHVFEHDDVREGELGEDALALGEAGSVTGSLDDGSEYTGIGFIELALAEGFVEDGAELLLELDHSVEAVRPLAFVLSE